MEIDEVIDTIDTGVNINITSIQIPLRMHLFSCIIGPVSYRKNCGKRVRRRGIVHRRIVDRVGETHQVPRSPQSGPKMTEEEGGTGKGLGKSNLR